MLIYIEEGQHFSTSARNSLQDRTLFILATVGHSASLSLYDVRLSRLTLLSNQMDISISTVNKLYLQQSRLVIPPSISQNVTSATNSKLHWLKAERNYSRQVVLTQRES